MRMGNIMSLANEDGAAVAILHQRISHFLGRDAHHNTGMSQVFNSPLL
jgi:hypothetical protein